MFRLIFRLKHSTISSVKFNSKFFFSSSYSFGALATFALVRLLSLSLSFSFYLSLFCTHKHALKLVHPHKGAHSLPHSLAQLLPLFRTQSLFTDKNFSTLSFLKKAHCYFCSHPSLLVTPHSLSLFLSLIFPLSPSLIQPPPSLTLSQRPTLNLPPPQNPISS